MKRSLIRAMLAVACAAIGVTGAVAGPAPEPPAVTVQVRPPVAYPGEELRVPVYLDGAGATSLGRTTLSLQFRPALMKYASFERGALLDHLGATLEAKSADGEDATTILSLTLAAKRGLTEGLMFYLTFRVDDSAPLGGDVPLQTRAEGTLVAGGPVTLPVEQDPLKISKRSKENEFEFACFFYMH